MTPKQREDAMAKVPLRRFGRPDEVAHAVDFLAHNKYANNCNIDLDGGISAVVSHTTPFTTPRAPLNSHQLTGRSFERRLPCTNSAM